MFCALSLMEGTATMSILAQRGTEKRVTNKRRSDMEEVKYVPGDLVMTDGAPIGTKKGVIYIVTASDPSRSLTLKDGTVNKGVVTLDAVSEDDKAHFVETSTWVKHIVPILLTEKILKDNGWKYKRESGIDTYTFGEDISASVIIEVSRDKEFCLTVSNSSYINLKIKHVHQLQHLLFGLGLDSNLKV